MASSEGDYRIDDSIPNADIDRLNAGTNLLLLGANIDDMRSVAEDFIAMATDDEEGAVWISLDGDLEWLIEDFADSPTALEHLSVIEADGAGPSAEELDPNHCFTVDSPERLTDLGMALIEYEDKIGRTFTGNRIVFDSITTLLAHVEEERVFQFIAAFGGRIRVSGNVGIWLMNVGEHSPQTVGVFRELFDIVVELPDQNGNATTEVDEEAGDSGG